MYLGVSSTVSSTEIAKDSSTERVVKSKESTRNGKILLLLFLLLLFLYLGVLSTGSSTKMAKVGSSYRALKSKESTGNKSKILLLLYMHICI